MITLQIPRLKLCSKCKEIKPFISYGKDNSTKSGLYAQCKECKNKNSKAYYNNNIKEITARRDNNREAMRESCRKSWAKHKKKRNEEQREFFNNNKELIASRDKTYRDNNKDKIAKRFKEYMKNNKEKVAKQRREYYKENKEEINRKNKIIGKKWRENNKERINEKSKAYYATPKGKAVARAVHKRRKCAIKNTEMIVTSEELVDIVENANNVCYWCNKKIVGTEHIDHYIPLAKGGKHSIDNMVVSCAKCNQSKGAKSPQEFANSLGKLC